MWPMLLDYTKDESKRILRRLELEAYASIISVFRAHGDLSKEKKKILQDLQHALSISTERHRAEVRRAINDEKLATIADNISGSMSTAEWMIEGRRLVPLMPRLVPQTAFTATANQAASAMMEKNASLPPPSHTGSKDGPVPPLPKPPRASSPTSNVVVLPSGTSIHIKGLLNQDEEDDMTLPSRRASHRSLSSDSQSAASVSTQTPRVTYTTASSTLPGSSPVKITISKSPQGRPISVQSSSQPPKVILVTSAGSAPGSTVIQRSMSVPVVKTPPTTMPTYTGSGPSRSSVLIPGGPSSSGPQVVSAYSSVVTSTSGSSLVSTTVTMPTSVIGSSPAMFSPSVQIGLGKVRPRIVPRQRYPAMLPPQKPGVVIPMGPQLMSPSQPVSAGIQASQVSSSGVTSSQHSGSGSSIQVRTLSKPTIQIKQEGGMKIITHSGTSKILPKPVQIAGSTGTPVVMVNTSPSPAGSTSGVTVLPRSISSYAAHSGGKVLNITTPGGRVIATTSKATNVVTVNPKTLQLTAVKSGTGSTTVSKPNVIVVQKSQHARFQSPSGPGGTNVRTITTTTAFPGAIDKELMGLVHKDSPGRHIVTKSSQSVGAGTMGRLGERRVIITTSGGSGDAKQPVSIIHRGRADSEGKTSLLAELIQAAGIMPSDAGVDNTGQSDAYDFESTDNTIQPPLSVASSISASLFTQQQQHLPTLPQQRRFQTVGHVTSSMDEEDSLGYNSQRRSSQDSDPGTEQVFTIEQAMSLLHKQELDLTESDTPVSVMASSILPTILTSSTGVSDSTPSIGQSKVSVLTTARPVSSETRRESAGREETMTGADQTEDGGSFSGILLSPEEGLKEGQLDTQTGLFYQATSSSSYNDSIAPGPLQTSASLPPSSLPASSSSTSSSLSSVQNAPGPSSSSSSLSLTAPPLDLLSSSLAEAQINLDPFNDDEEEDYGDEDEEVEDEDEAGHDLGLEEGPVGGECTLGSRPGLAEVLREETAKDGTRILTVSNPASSQHESLNPHTSLLVSLPAQLSRSSSLLSTMSSTSSLPVSYVPPREAECPPVSRMSSSDGMLQATLTPGRRPSPQTSVLPIAVSVEPSSSVITFNLDELTSQRVALEGEQGEEANPLPETATEPELAPGTDTPTVEALTGSEDTIANLASTYQEDAGAAGTSDAEPQSDGPMSSSDPSGLIRSSKRKRKHPSGPDELSQAAAGSWVKSAANLLMKVARFKGSPRDKSEIPAAEWFTFPVDPVDAPDYYTVITTPMDFSTMRKKLETGQYGSFEDFDADMQLVQTNCYLYNSEGTKVRRDCDEVMAFYTAELARMQEKQVSKAFQQNSSPLKRPRTDEKPPQKQ